MALFSNIQTIDLIFSYNDLGGAKTYTGTSYKARRNTRYYSGDEHSLFLNKTQDSHRRSLRDTVRRFGLANVHKIVRIYQERAPQQKQVVFGNSLTLQLVMLASRAVSLLPFAAKAQINVTERETQKPVLIFPPVRKAPGRLPLMFIINEKAKALHEKDRLIVGGYRENTISLSADGKRVLSTKDANGQTLRQRLRAKYTERQTRALMASFRDDLQQRAAVNLAAITRPGNVTLLRPGLKIVDKPPVAVAA